MRLMRVEREDAPADEGFGASDHLADGAVAVLHGWGKLPAMFGPRMRPVSEAGTRPSKTRRSVPRLTALNSARTTASPGLGLSASTFSAHSRCPTYQSAGVEAGMSCFVLKAFVRARQRPMWRVIARRSTKIESMSAR